jgi:hypothetical protein
VAHRSFRMVFGRKCTNSAVFSLLFRSIFQTNLPEFKEDCCINFMSYLHNMHKVKGLRLEAFMTTELYKIFSGNKPCQLWTKAQRFGDHLRLHHQGNDVKVDRWWCLYTWSKFPLERVDDGGGDGLWDVGLLTTTDTACFPRRFYKVKGCLYVPY